MYLLFHIPNSVFAESGSIAGVFSIGLKLTLAQNYWDSDSMRKAKMGQDSFLSTSFCPQG